MNVQQTVNISTNKHNERIKTKYIPSYIFENEGKLFKKSYTPNRVKGFGEVYNTQKSFFLKCFSISIKELRVNI